VGEVNAVAVERRDDGSGFGEVRHRQMLVAQQRHGRRGQDQLAEAASNGVEALEQVVDALVGPAEIDARTGSG
jgi:hypothetical protein